MHHRITGFVAASISLFAAALAFAQQPATTTAQTTTATAAEVEGGTPKFVKPETPAQRHERVGLVDPGPNPDEKSKFYRYGKEFHIEKYDRKWAAFDQGDPALVRADSRTPFVFEVYQMNEKWVWVWVQDTPVNIEAYDKQQAEATGQTGMIGQYTEGQANWLRYIRPEFSELKPAVSKTTIKFEDASDGLPTSGSWRNSLAVADMNGDGFADIITPPQRGGSNGLPTIFLGDGKGHWTPWQTVWPYRIDYGSVAAGDFNKDGKMDVAFSVHLQGVRVFLGDGKGHFADASKGLPQADFPSRRVAVKDMDGDGYLDVIAISEGPVGREAETTTYGKVRVFLNRKKGTEWEGIDAADPKYTVGGDYIALGNFNGDAIPDFFGASVYYQAHNLLYMSDKKKKLTWAPAAKIDDGKIVPFLSYYTAMTAGPFSSKKLDDVIVSYLRYWPDNVDAQIASRPTLDKIVGIDRITFTGTEAKRVPILRIGSARPISGMGAGDFDGDGNLDVAFTMFEPNREAVVLLGDGKGNFARATLSGVTLEPQPNYDLTVADLNGDGRPDLVVMYESGNESKLGLQNGSIHAFINRGADGASPKAQKK